jgi:hypothetical protein
MVPRSAGQGLRISNLNKDHFMSTHTDVQPGTEAVTPSLSIHDAKIVKGAVPNVTPASVSQGVIAPTAGTLAEVAQQTP